MTLGNASAVAGERIRGSRAAHLATLLCVLAAAAAVTYLGYFLFGPTYNGCELGPVSPTAAPGAPVCRTMGWLEMQFGRGYPGPIDLRPLAFLGAWTAAPFVALVGTKLRSRGVGTSLVALALLVDASSIISMGGGFVYAILCGPLLLVALLAMLVAFTQSRMG
ncbi:MAG TPA: hypothetical protein VFV20_01865 [Candidatus Limnocylindria bacterium]|nr:hypothetical protein [Candidatus Limnocylindria bacterium]